MPLIDSILYCINANAQRRHFPVKIIQLQRSIWVGRDEKHRKRCWQSPCASLSRLVASNREVWARKREAFVEHIQVLRLPEPIKLWIKEASRDGLHDYHHLIPVSLFLSSFSNTVFLSQPPRLSKKGHEVMLREIFLLPVHSSEYLIRTFLPVDYPQLTNVAGQRNTGINYLALRKIRERYLLSDSNARRISFVTIKYLIIALLSALCWQKILRWRKWRKKECFFSTVFERNSLTQTYAH